MKSITRSEMTILDTIREIVGTSGRAAALYYLFPAFSVLFLAWLISGWVYGYGNAPSWFIPIANLAASFSGVMVAVVVLLMYGRRRCKGKGKGGPLLHRMFTVTARYQAARARDVDTLELSYWQGGFNGEQKLRALEIYGRRRGRKEAWQLRSLKSWSSSAAPILRPAYPCLESRVFGISRNWRCKSVPGPGADTCWRAIAPELSLQDILPAQLKYARYGDLMRYMIERFGFSQWDPDNDDDSSMWYLTTPSASVLLGVSPDPADIRASFSCLINELAPAIAPETAKEALAATLHDL